MKLHVLGACGTFMAGVAYIARQLGHEVIGVDQNVYPPMSDFLRAQGITLLSGYENYKTLSAPDLVIVGNAMSRGNPAIEHLLDQRWKYISGPQWLYENVLCHKKVLAVSGTHGKTTTSSMLAWILQYAGLSPSFLIGGIPQNFNTSACVNDSPYFVIEADEYDSAFFDKRSKFLHYHPETLIINNIEFDHADIFSSLEDIKKQFHYLLRTVPCAGTVIYPHNDKVLTDLFAMGLWSQSESFGLDQDAKWTPEVFHSLGDSLEKMLPLLGKHNRSNALAAIAAAHSVGVEVSVAVHALTQFQGVKRRLEKIAEVKSVMIFEDFAHHPTAIETTLDGLRKHRPEGRLIALLELASYTMKAGVHKTSLIPALKLADEVHILQTAVPHEFDVPKDRKNLFYPVSVEEMIAKVCSNIQVNDTVLIMSNRDFGDIYTKLPERLLRLRMNKHTMQVTKESKPQDECFDGQQRD
ncbi:MAG: UDP-N-acetylmuramate:L-alanyl-gamma-D-glutamyl-meso-diaminopimelate ligase [Gammaproteobacteria bacterium]|nr:UDP-N-acetylmuramate:L-alanyl-gamma-D-glutamyl-meso-diaminopimelate ligase [Gammaproteobacteria bacterium]